MLCPFCREKDTSVVDSRPTEDGTAIRRRRLCPCSKAMRFTTFERVQHRELSVIKKNGRRVPFDREKLAKSFFTALKKTNSDWNFVISIDLPLMKSSIIKEIWELGNKSKNAIIPRVDGYLQPICSFYHKRILSQILNQIESNELSLNGLISSVETNYIDMDNYKKEFLNMNTQKEYNKIIDSIIEE